MRYFINSDLTKGVNRKCTNSGALGSCIWDLSFANKLKESLNFWKMSINSASGGGLALMDNIPSPRSFFLDLRLRRRFSSSRKAAAECWSLAMNFSISSKQLLRILTSFSYLSLDVELVSSFSRLTCKRIKNMNEKFYINNHNNNS